MPRHRLPISRDEIPLPEWVKSEDNDCLRSIAEEVYTARSLALSYSAHLYPACRELISAGDKARATMDDARVESKSRCAAGERALRKFWEAKSCARRQQAPSGKSRFGAK